MQSVSTPVLRWVHFPLKNFFATQGAKIICLQVLSPHNHLSCYCIACTYYKQDIMCSCKLRLSDILMFVFISLTFCYWLELYIFTQKPHFLLLSSSYLTVEYSLQLRHPKYICNTKCTSITEELILTLYIKFKQGSMKVKIVSFPFDMNHFNH